MKRLIMIVVLAIVGIFALSACDTPTEPSPGQKQETKTVQDNYDRLVQNQPAHTMNYSPTRATKNFWIDTWGQKGKTSYVYLMNDAGKVIGYYVLEGLPVNYCTSLVVPYQIQKFDNGTNGGVSALSVPAPSVDGTFSSGGACDTFYGKDANTGAYIQYTAGMGLNPLLYDQPLAPGIIGGAPNLGNVK